MACLTPLPGLQLLAELLFKSLRGLLGPLKHPEGEQLLLGKVGGPQLGSIVPHRLEKKNHCDGGGAPHKRVGLVADTS